MQRISEGFGKMGVPRPTVWLSLDSNFTSPGAHPPSTSPSQALQHPSLGNVAKAALHLRHDPQLLQQGRSHSQHPALGFSWTNFHTGRGFTPPSCWLPLLPFPLPLIPLSSQPSQVRACSLPSQPRRSGLCPGQGSFSTTSPPHTPYPSALPPPPVSGPFTLPSRPPNVPTVPGPLSSTLPNPYPHPRHRRIPFNSASVPCPCVPSRLHAPTSPPRVP